MDTLITEEVIALTYNSDSFPMRTGLPLEKIRLIDPLKTDRIKESLRTGFIKLVIIDGCLPIDTVLIACESIKKIRRDKKLNITICIINQDELFIEGTIWEQKPESVQKYLIAA